MKRTHALFAAALLGGALAAAPHAADAAQSCANAPRASYYGVVTAVRPAYFTLRTGSSLGSIHVYTHGSHINYNGTSLQPGVSAGVYGCRWESRDGLVAEDVTLDPNRGGNRYTSNDRVVEGRIDSVRSDRILIDSGNGHGDTWVITNGAQSFRNGEVVRATGYFSQDDQAFVARNVEILTAYNGTTWSNGNVVEGRIDSVRPGRVLIDSNGGHGNLWVVTNSNGLRTGELIRATGHFDANDRAFVATGITVEAM